MLERDEDALSTESLRMRLNEALAGLPEEQRIVIRDVYFGGLSLSVIAQRHGLPLGTVKSRLRLAMAKLTESVRGSERR
jgi:RNA polymerase sigma-70 factor (ECF subfamily)